MKIDIKGTNIDLTGPLKEYILKKIGQLHKFLGQIDKDHEVEARVEVGRTTEHHHKGKVFRAEANIKVPGKLLRAEYEDFDIRIAIDKVRDILKREIEKYKDIGGR